MVSRYSVIQYVPNPVSGERINVGVLAFDDEEAQVSFLSNWDRVRYFGRREDVSLLREFAQTMKNATQSGLLFPGESPSEIPRHEQLRTVTEGWMNSIQFTEPKGSLETVDGLLTEMVQTYLLDVGHTTRARDRQAAARVATSRIRNLLKRQFGNEAAKELLRTNYELPGSHKEHKFDVTVANGKPFFAAHGISFEVQTSEAVMDALAWMIVDVKKISPEFPLAVVTLPPTHETPDRLRLTRLYKRTANTYQDLGAKVLVEEEVDPWVASQLEAISVS